MTLCTCATPALSRWPLSSEMTLQRARAQSQRSSFTEAFGTFLCISISSSQSPSPPWPPMRVLGPGCVPLPPLFSIGHRCVPLIILLCSIGHRCANHLSCIYNPWSFSRHSLQPCTRTLRDSQVPCTGVPVEGSTRVTHGRLPQPAVRSLCLRSHTSSNSLSAAHHTQHSALTITQYSALTTLLHHHFSPPLLTRHHHHHHHHHHHSPLTTHHSPLTTHHSPLTTTTTHSPPPFPFAPHNHRFNREYLNIVADDLHERAFMIQSAPFMTRPIPMMIPLYRWWELPLMRVTGLLYDLIAGRRRTVPPSTYIPASEALYVNRAAAHPVCL
jgi:hypothetical protein